MLSKPAKIVIASTSFLILAILVFFTLKPKKNLNPQVGLNREITLNQLGISDQNTTVYQDSAGFSFKYPADFDVQPIELEDSSIYSSLEITGPDNTKIYLKIQDTGFQNFADWLKDFETDQVVISLADDFWSDIEAHRLIYSAPKKRLTVALENQTLYTLETPFEPDALTQQIHNLILNSFEFADEVYDLQSTSQASEDGVIVLIEEIIKEAD